MTVSVCRSCGARIRWVKMVRSGQVMPLDADPVEDGEVIIHTDGETAAVPTKEEWEKIKAELGDKAEALGRHRYRSHFATCPNAKQHRKSR